MEEKFLKWMWLEVLSDETKIVNLTPERPVTLEISNLKPQNLRFRKNKCCPTIRVVTKVIMDRIKVGAPFCMKQTTPYLKHQIVSSVGLMSYNYLH